MKLIPTELTGAVIIEPAVFADDRGWFMESFNGPRFEVGLAALGLPPADAFVPDNHSSSQAGVLRGLHDQLPPHLELTAANRRQFWAPPGFAHGFVALEDDTHFLYKTTDVYAKDCERSIRLDDPANGIDWPLAAAPTLAAKDAEASPLEVAKIFPSDAPSSSIYRQGHA